MHAAYYENENLEHFQTNSEMPVNVVKNDETGENILQILFGLYITVSA